MAEVLSSGWLVVKQDSRGSVGYCIEAVPLEGLPGQVVRAIVVYLFVWVFFAQIHNTLKLGYSRSLPRQKRVSLV